MQNNLGGSYSWNVICKVCGFKYKASQTKKRWDGLQPVCEDCWETRHPLDFYRPRDDTHKLSFTNPEATVNYTFLPTDFDEDFDWLLDTLVDPVVTEGLSFTVNSDGYIHEVRVHMGGEEGDYSTGLLARESQEVRLYAEAGETLVWSKVVTNFKQGWNSIPVVPNVAVTATASYRVAKRRYLGETTSYNVEATIGSIAAQTHLTYNDTYYTLSDAYPNLASLNFFPMNVSMRPT